MIVAMSWCGRGGWKVSDVGCSGREHQAISVCSSEVVVLIGCNKQFSLCRIVVCCRMSTAGFADFIIGAARK